MNIIKLFTLLLVASTLLVTSCKKDQPANVENTEQNENDENKDDENNGENEGNKDDEDNGENDWQTNPQPLPEATYALANGIIASDYVNYADGKRNDYVSFYESETGYALFIDLYTAESNTLLNTGRYLLADNFDNSAYREYTYITFETNGDLYRFTEGWVEVIADAEHSSGYPYHKIRAYFVMESGESVSLEFEGTIQMQ